MTATATAPLPRAAHHTLPLLLLLALASSQPTCPCRLESLPDCAIPRPSSPGTCNLRTCAALTCTSPDLATGDCALIAGSYFFKTGEDGGDGTAACELRSVVNVAVPGWAAGGGEGLEVTVVSETSGVDAGAFNAADANADFVDVLEEQLIAGAGAGVTVASSEAMAGTPANRRRIMQGPGGGVRIVTIIETQFPSQARLVVDFFDVVPPGAGSSPGTDACNEAMSEAGIAGSVLASDATSPLPTMPPAPSDGLPSGGPPMPSGGSPMPSDGPPVPSVMPPMPSDGLPIPSIMPPPWPSDGPPMPSMMPPMPSDMPPVPSGMPPMPSGMPPMPSDMPMPSMMPSMMPPMPSMMPPMPTDTPLTCPLPECMSMRLPRSVETPFPLIESYEHDFFPFCFGSAVRPGYPDCPEDEYPTEVVLRLLLDPARELPCTRKIYHTHARGTDTFAEMTGLMSTRNNQVCAECVFVSGIKSEFQAMHLHAPAQVDENAVPVLTLTSDVQNRGKGVYFVEQSCFDLTAQVAEALDEGLSYLNFHTAEFPGGEIRGQMEAYHGTRTMYSRGPRTSRSIYTMNTWVSGPGTSARGRAEISVIDRGVVCFEDMFFWNNDYEPLSVSLNGPGGPGSQAPGLIFFDRSVINVYDDGAVYGTPWLCVSADEKTVRAFLNEEIYMNFTVDPPPESGIGPHTIRGQVTFEDVPLPNSNRIEATFMAAPGVSTPADGTAMIRVNEDTICMENLEIFGVLSSFTNLHLHGPAAIGGSAGVLVSLATPVFSSIGDSYKATSWCRGITKAIYKDIVRNKTYLNVHSTAHPGGEIRSHLILADINPYRVTNFIFNDQLHETGPIDWGGAMVYGEVTFDYVAGENNEACFYATWSWIETEPVSLRLRTRNGLWYPGDLYHVDHSFINDLVRIETSYGVQYRLESCFVPTVEVSVMIIDEKTTMELRYPLGEISTPVVRRRY